MIFSEFNHKVVLITGAAGSIGEALCRGFSQSNSKVYQTDIQYIDHPFFIQGDISDVEFIKLLVDQIIEKEGRIDILVNSAGVCPRTALMDIAADEWQKVMDINLKSVFFLSQAVLGIMIKNKSGTIVNLASLAGKVGGIAVGAHYSASKAAIECLTKSLAKAGAPHGIRVNAVAPGIIDSEIHKNTTPEQHDQYKSTIPLGRMGTTDEVANIVLMLASDLASYVTGTTIDVNGGLRM